MHQLAGTTVNIQLKHQNLTIEAEKFEASKSDPNAYAGVLTHITLLTVQLVQNDRYFAFKSKR